MCRKIELKWAPLGISVTASLLEDRNPELCQEFWNNLPFKSIESHAVIDGQDLYCWLPYIPSARARYKEGFDKLPLGTIVCSGIGIRDLKYGPCMNTMQCSPIAKISDRDHRKIRLVGKTIWESIFLTKELIVVTTKRGNRDEKAEILEET